MKRNIQVLTLLVGVALISNAYALTAGGSSGPAPVATQVTVTTTSSVQTPVLAPVEEARPIGLGNKSEKEITPLLREVARKRTALDIRKLDREFEKMDEEALKSQAEREKLTAPPAIAALPTPVSSREPVAMNSTAINSQTDSDIRVLMVYGSDNNLYAKISTGTQGGYPVHRGDILPDGRTVFSVQPNFIEVKKANKNKKGSIQRIPVTGAIATGDSFIGRGALNAPMIGAMPSGLPAVNTGTPAIINLGKK